MKNNIEESIYKDYMHNQFEKIEGFNFSNMVELKNKIKKEVLLTYYPSYKHLLPKNKAASILELGSGFGRFPYMCKMAKYNKYTGVDLSTEGIKICKKLFPEYKFLETSFNNFFKKNKNKFDVIFLAHVLEHVKKNEIPEFIENIKSILSKSGKVIITVPNASAYFGATAGRYIDFTHEIAFTHESLEELLVAKSFKQINSYNIQVNIPLYKKVIHELLRNLLEIFIIILGYKREKIYSAAFITTATKLND